MSVTVEVAERKLRASDRRGALALRAPRGARSGVFYPDVVVPVLGGGAEDEERSPGGA
jgi:hypothetical protein